MKPINYLLEPLLNSELILINNSKLLKKDGRLLNEEHIERINELKEEFIELDKQTENGVQGLQRQKRKVRDEIRDLSVKTYTHTNGDIFGIMITTIVNRIASRPQFSNYTYLDEMKSLAKEHILKYTFQFNPYRQSKITGQYASAFAYISTITFNAFIATINKRTKEQLKAKEDFLETQKLIHRDPNKSTIGPDFSTPTRVVKFVELLENDLINKIKKLTISEETEFWIPESYKITEKDYNYIMKYSYNISVKRIKSGD